MDIISAKKILEIVEVVDWLSFRDEPRSISSKFSNIGYTNISDRYPLGIWLSGSYIWVLANMV